MNSQNSLHTSKKLLKNTSDVVFEIKRIERNQEKLIKEQEEFKRIRQDFSIGIILSYLLDIEASVNTIEQLKFKWKKDSSNKEYESSIKVGLHFLKRDLKNITYQLTFSADVLKPQLVEKIRFLLEITDIIREIH